MIVVLIWCVVALGLSVLAAEAVVRLFFTANPSFKARESLNLAYEPSGFVCYFPTPNQVIYERNDDGVLYDKPRYRINKYGYRGQDFPLEKAPDEIRIVFLGGSHVFDVCSYDYREDLGFPHLMERSFQEAGYDVRVINAGLPGNDTRYFSAKVLLDLHRFRPDIIVAGSIWNDLKWISRADDETLFLRFSPKALRKNPMTEKVNFLDSVCGFSASYRHVRDVYWQRKLKLHQDKVIHEGFAENSEVSSCDSSRGLEQYRQNLTGLVSLIKSIGATPVLTIEERFISPSASDADKRKIPYHMVNVSTHSGLIDLFGRCEAVIEEVSDACGVSLINLQPEMEGREEYFFDHIHTSSEGSRFIALHYFNALRKIIDKRESSGVQRFSASTIR